MPIAPSLIWTGSAYEVVAELSDGTDGTYWSASTYLEKGLLYPELGGTNYYPMPDGATFKFDYVATGLSPVVRVRVKGWYEGQQFIMYGQWVDAGTFWYEVFSVDQADAYQTFTFPAPDELRQNWAYLVYIIGESSFFCSELYVEWTVAAPTLVVTGTTSDPKFIAGRPGASSSVFVRGMS